MRYIFLLIVLALAMGEVGAADAAALEVAVDFEERPVPNLARISNIYRGDADYLYAFLVIRGAETQAEEMYVAAYDIGYRLISPDSSVVNHGFHRLDTWESLSATDDDFPADLNLPGARVPAAIGYWELGLAKGSKSRGELQIIPNPVNQRSEVALVGGHGEIITLPNHELSQDVTCHGLINRTFYPNEPYDIDGLEYVPGQLLASFMPGVIEMEGRWGSINAIADPGLKRVAEDFRLTRIRRLFRNAERNPTPRLSRTGELFTPLNRWDDYVLYFADATDISKPLDAVRALPRCAHAKPNLVGELLSTGHVPNDSLAADSLAWHLHRINMPAAWDLEIGDPWVRIGVVDGGVDYHLEDFGSGIGSGYKVADGYDYAMDDEDPRVEWGDDFCETPELQRRQDPNHGNWVHSIVGALTNNDSVGVAGVAGGWGGYDGELGPSLCHFKIREDICGPINGEAVADAVGNAFDDYQCLVLSNSISTSIVDVYLKGAIRDFHNAGGVFVASTNNRHPGQPTGTSTHYPGYYRNDWVLCVQGSSRHPIDEEDATLEQRVSREDSLYTWDADWPPPYWPAPLLSIDVCAPASHMCLIYADSLLGQKPLYGQRGSGVSYSPPQVAGVVALMLSNSQEYLLPSDIEGLVSASCTDITSDYEEPDSLPGWDKYTGWGRINADSCLMFLDGSHYSVWSFNEYGGGVVVDSSATLERTWFDGDGPLNSDWYLAKRYEVRRDVTPSPGYHFLWGRPCAGAGWGWTGQSPISDPYNFQTPYCDLVPSTQYETTCTLFSYVYEVWSCDTTYCYGVYPNLPHLLDWSYGILVDEGYPAVHPGANVDAADHLKILSIAPNPGKGEVLISFQMPSAERVALSVYDVTGREVRTMPGENLKPGTYQRRWDGRNNSGKPVAPGVYMCRVATADKCDMKKILLVRKGGN